MPLFGNLAPSKGVNRWPRSYRAVPNQDLDEPYDIEKTYDSDEDDDSESSPSSNFSSRTSSGAYQPMIRKVSRLRSRPALFTIRSPRAFTRIFTLAIGTTLILFILTLTRLGWSSAKNVQLGAERSKGQPPVWESFPFLKRYHGGIRTLTSRSENVPEYPSKDSTKDIPVQEKESGSTKERREEAGIPPSNVFDPSPDFTKDLYYSQYEPAQPCYLDEAKTIKVPMLRAYNGVPNGMPDNVIGSYDVLGIRNDVCFERYGRLGPYGLGYSKKMGGSGAGLEGDREGAELVWKDDPEVDYTRVQWADAQDRCMDANRLRFKALPKGRNHFYQTMGSGGPDRETPASTSAKITTIEEEPELTASTSKVPHSSVSKRENKKLLPRHAVIIRTWWDYKYDDEDLFYLRALISELSLLSGGEYTIHFLIHVKDDNSPIWSDDEVYQRVLNDSLPEEFRGMGTLWTERQMGLIYGGLEETFYRNLPVHGAYRSTYLPLQYFAHQHPEYDFFWQWEMDLRYTGHFYHLFHKLGEWARRQPRKLLWERSSRFYVPSEHGSWDDFNHLVRVQTEHGTASKNNVYTKLAEYHSDLPASAQAAGRPETPIWGPERPLDDEFEIENDPSPPEGVSYKDDNYEWGVGEDADLIVLNPLFDPEGTNWILAEDVTGYNKTRGFPPRRTAIVTAGRLSRRLLLTMHRESSLKRHSMFSEMWPASCALHHGLKAVYAPHPVFIDRRWPTDYLAAIFNGGRNGASGGGRLSVFSDERQHNFKGTTWYYDAGFAPNLWKRWLGYKVDNDGGEEWEVNNEGRMCLPAMLLHPVKEVELVYQD